MQDSISDLGGKTYAIVNHQASNSQGTALQSEQWAVGLAGMPVEVDAANGYVTGDFVTLWTFEAVDAASGQYSISTQVGDETKYLSIADDGTLTLFSSPQTITITADSGGKVKLTANGSVISLNGSGFRL